ncbi:DUF6259 domain-containing protein [Thiolapillus sp.]
MEAKHSLLKLAALFGCFLLSAVQANMLSGKAPGVFAPPVTAPPSGEQHNLGNGPLQATLITTGNGVLLSSIRNAGRELLNTNATTELFTLFLTNLTNGQDVELKASEGWSNVTFSGDTSHAIVELAAPLSPDLPHSLKARLTVAISGSHSEWDLSISGLGNTTLNQAFTPRINIRAEGNDHLLLPRFSGVLFDDPVANSIHWQQIYPAGWHATMQFLAYYGTDYGLYFGFHDPQASTKTFDISENGGGIAIEARYTATNKSLAGNDWDMPGVFALDLFSGDWYDAALHYRAWASTQADFWPRLDAERSARLRAIGNISLWATSGSGNAPADIEPHVLDFARYMGVPVGLTWYKWNSKDFDADYPEYFPEQDGMDVTTAHLQAAGVQVAPYINGRLFDTSLDGSGPSGLNFPTDGQPHAAKKNSLGDYFTQTFNGNTFAVMCPTRRPWQDILRDASDQLTRRIGVAGLYIDQIGAASPVECMDASHQHPLAGGAWWTRGYRSMLERIRQALAPGKFTTTENGADNLLNQFDGLMVQGWQANNLVPAFQAVYAGRIILFGVKTGVSQYTQPQFYAKLSQAFVHGVQPGRFYTSIQNETGAREVAPLFIRKLARLRHKLTRFMSFGSLLRPLSLGGIPSLTSTWTHTYDGDVSVTIPAIQTSTWLSTGAEEKRLAVVFVNASTTETIPFSFQLDAAEHGLNGQIYVQEIRDTTNLPVQPTASVFTKSLSLAPMDAVAFVLSTSPQPLETLLFSDGFEDR